MTANQINDIALEWGRLLFTGAAGILTPASWPLVVYFVAKEYRKEIVSLLGKIKHFKSPVLEVSIDQIDPPKRVEEIKNHYINVEEIDDPKTSKM